MKSILYWGLVLILAGALFAVFILYYNVEQVAWKSDYLLSSLDKQWLLSGDQHLFDITQRSIDLGSVIGLKKGRNEWQAIGRGGSFLQPRFANLDTNRCVKDDEYVIGVVNGSTATAYPFKVLVKHKIINDNSQDPTVCVYFGAASRTFAAYARGTQGDADVLACTGFMYNRVDLPYDAGTESLFLPLTGRFVAGRRIGERFKRLPCAVVTLARWRALYPKSRIMTVSTGVPSMKYPRADIPGGRGLSEGTITGPKGRKYAAKGAVLLLEAEGNSLLVSFDAARTDAKRDIAVSLEGRQVVVHFDEGYTSAWVTDASGNLVPSVRTVLDSAVKIFPDIDIAEGSGGD
ncbi:MAG: DUF3179 domain-containing protein [Planctomycetes bacterium]|nr:DUF3179 domain-containing protein [Planctomycetota bacterium]